MRRDEAPATADRRITYTREFRGIYLAGKVAQRYDWRADLVDYADDSGKSRTGGIIFDRDYDSESPDYGHDHWPARKNALFGRYDYTSPLVQDMSHSDNSFSGGFGPEPLGGRQLFVVAECLAAIRRSDQAQRSGARLG